MIGIATLLGACTNEADEPAYEEEDYAITLSAAISGIDSKTRAVDAYNDTVPSPSNPLNADVWLSTTRGEYLNDADGYVTSTHPGTDEYHLHHTITYTNNQLTFLSASAMRNLLLYPVNTEHKTYIVGFAPQGKFSLTGSSGDTGYGKTASATIDAKTDLMFAPEVMGSRVKEEKIARQDFKHILTWLKICARADNEEAKNSWGSIIGLKLKNTSNKVTVDLSTTDINTLKPTFSGSTDLDFDKTPGGGAITEANPYALTTYVYEMADILCAPVTISNPSESDSGTAEYTLEVTTTGNGTKEVSVQLTKDYDSDLIPDGHYTASELYVITLAFGQSPTISATCSLMEWQEEKRDLNLK